MRYLEHVPAKELSEGEQRLHWGTPWVAVRSWCAVINSRTAGGTPFKPSGDKKLPNKRGNILGCSAVEKKNGSVDGSSSAPHLPAQATGDPSYSLFLQRAAQLHTGRSANINLVCPSCCCYCDLTCHSVEKTFSLWEITISLLRKLSPLRPPPVLNQLAQKDQGWKKLQEGKVFQHAFGAEIAQTAVPAAIHPTHSREGSRPRALHRSLADLHF